MLGSERYAAGGFAGLVVDPPAPDGAGRDDPSARPGGTAAPVAGRDRRALWLTIMPVPEAVRPPRRGLFSLDHAPSRGRSLRRATALHPAGHQPAGHRPQVGPARAA